MFPSFLFDLPLLIPLFVIGGICSYTDIKYGKIFNKWIIIGLFWGISFNIFLLFYNFFFLFQPSNIKYLIEVSTNTLISFLVGYLLWNFKLWSAGDAKFFTLCALLLPLKFYSKSYLIFFPSFNLLVNLFVPLLLILTFTAFLIGIKELFNYKKRLKNIKKISIKKVFSIFKALGKKLSQLFFNFIFMFILLQQTASFRKFIPGEELLFNPITIFFLLLVFSSYFSKIQAKKKWIGYFINGTILLYCSYLILSGKIEILKLILKNTLFFMVLITFLRQILNFYIEKKEVEKIKIKDIEKGVVISKNELDLILKELKRKGMYKSFGEIIAEGLKENQVKIIKDLFTENPNIEIKIYKTFPFAPFMLLSVIISILTTGSFIDFLIYRL